ncbi:hypothetical protein GGI35DRAFT_427810 [Trichoderma velutinum]
MTRQSIISPLEQVEIGMCARSHLCAYDMCIHPISVRIHVCCQRLDLTSEYSPADLKWPCHVHCRYGPERLYVTEGGARIHTRSRCHRELGCLEELLFYMFCFIWHVGHSASRNSLFQKRAPKYQRWFTWDKIVRELVGVGCMSWHGSIEARKERGIVGMMEDHTMKLLGISSKRARCTCVHGKLVIGSETAESRMLFAERGVCGVSMASAVIHYMAVLRFVLRIQMFCGDCVLVCFRLFDLKRIHLMSPSRFCGVMDFFLHPLSLLSREITT